MMHKKSKHIEKVSFCWNYESGSCIYGDKNCWYVHEPKDELETSEEFKCNERQFTFTYDFFKHRKKNLTQSVPICNKCCYGD